jgi:uncharacterized protein (DUF58 family)
MRWWLGALLLLAIGYVFRLGLLVYAMYVFLGMLGLSRVWARRWTSDLIVTRRCTVDAVEMGETGTIELTLRNEGRGRVPWLLVEESLPLEAFQQHPPRLRVTGARIAVLTLRPGEIRTLSYRIEFNLRGYYQIGPMLLESGDLFGLHRRYRIATDPLFVLVRPKVLPLEGYDLASRRPLGEVRIRHRLFEDPTRISGVRPYERGDPLNRIHWRATARTGLLHSKSYEPSCVAGATLLLDFHRDSFLSKRQPAYTPDLARRMEAYRTALPDVFAVEAEGPLVELAVTTVASLANAVHELGQQIGFVSNGRDAAERIRQEGWRREFRTRAMAKVTLARRDPNERLEPVSVETRRGSGQLDRILDTLARLELTDGLPFADLLFEVSGRLPRDATVAAVLTQVTEETAFALGNLKRGGFAVMVVLVSFEAIDYHDWSSPPEWAERLMAEGIEFRRVQDETSLTQLCAEHFVR